ncbi:hypothetical protein H4R99_004530 [Coemansia sp. RSA 1722]|nr:hypothetical protein LPJ57_007268 [Coemansia sp. RSA 486]KAJ2236802.1 hypothetical protein IWW45_001492 [Coemansia sp. RSA 485]KAJ2597374.1 hypothetical protein H4R99_004530 [Coemansia sp. RSA 1722]
MAVNDASGNSATTTSTAMPSQPPPAPTGNCRRDASADNPTWDEVEQTRTPVQKQPWPRRYNVRRFCMVDDMFVTMDSFASSSSKRQTPITGKMTCLERVAPEMAQQRLVERQKTTSGPASGWYSRWLLDWQVVRILGRNNILVFQLHSDRLQPSQAILEKVIKDKEERQQMTQIEPLDHAVVKWRKDAVGFFWRVLEPGIAMTRKMAESWRDGQQQRMFALLWKDTVDLKGVKLVGRIADHVGKVFDEAMDEDDQDSKRKK